MAKKKKVASNLRPRREKGFGSFLKKKNKHAIRS